MWIAGGVVYITADTGEGHPQVYQYVPPSGAPSAAASNWTVLTGSNTTVNTVVVQDSIQLYMLASNSGSSFAVWAFSGIGWQVNSTWGWAPLTQPITFQV